MRLKIFFIFLIILFLDGCSSCNFTFPFPFFGNCRQPGTPIRSLNGCEASLSEASYNVSRSIVSLAETAAAAQPCLANEPPPDPTSYGMGFPTAVEWSGPIEPLVREMAKAADYRVRVLGRPPAIPVLVSVYAKNTMLADILRDVGYQAGRRASVVVFPGSRVIELRYAPN